MHSLQRGWNDFIYVWDTPAYPDGRELLARGAGALRQVTPESFEQMARIWRGATARQLSIFDREDPLAKRHIALQHGPVMLAQENRLGYSVDDPIEVKINANETVDAIFPAQPKNAYDCLLEMQLPLTDGSYMTVTDYGSAGKLWNDETKMAVWMLTKG